MENTPTTLVLHVVRSSGQRETVAVPNEASFQYTLLGGPTLRFTRQGGLLAFRDLSASCAVYKDGINKPSGMLEVGSSLEIGSYRIVLWDTGAPAAFLKGCTAPFSNDIWTLGPGEHTIGRPGKRSNAISLEHPTVSREHARIQGLADGRFQILAEASTNPVYRRGYPIEPGAATDLSHGDLLEVGELHFRFYHPPSFQESPTETLSLRVASSGGFRVYLGEVEIAEGDWPTEESKWMFAHLAYVWGRPLLSEDLAAELWPAATQDEAHANFKQTLSSLRRWLRGKIPEAASGDELILRGSATLQLNPDRLDRHDAVTINRLVKALGLEEDEIWEHDAQVAVLAHSGPFIPSCSLPWALEAGKALEGQIAELARFLLDKLLDRGKYLEAIEVAKHVLSYDPNAQWACLSAMRGLSHSNRAADALAFFEGQREVWQRHASEPGDEVRAEADRLMAL